MKRKGYTLIELMIVLCIMSVLFCAAGGAAMKSNIAEDMKSVSIKHDIASLISLAKHYSYYTGNPGRIEINKSQGTISFVDAKSETTKKVIAKVSIPEGYSFLATFNIAVSNNGTVGSDSIIFKNLNGEYHKVTISVGIDLINIY